MGSFLKKAGLAAATGGLSLLAGGMGGDGNAAPAIDPRVAENAAFMGQTGRNLIASNKTAMERANPVFDAGVGRATTIADTALGRSGQMYDTYSGSFLPVTQQVATDAMTWDSPDALARAANQAGATVGKNYAKVGNQRGAMMAKYGLNPTAALAMEQQTGVQQAADMAAAENAAREGRTVQGAQLRTNAANVGSNVLQGATALDSMAMNGGNAAAALEAERINTANAGTNAALPWLTGANNSFLGVNNAQMDAWKTNESLAAARSAGIGKLLGTAIGAGAGFMMGGPPGAMAGANVGASAGSSLNV